MSAAPHLLDMTTYVVKEHVGMMKLTDTYDILDPNSGEKVAVAKEKPHSMIAILRLFMNKSKLPTKVLIAPDEDSPPLVTIERPMSFLRATVRILDSQGSLIGTFRSHLISVGGAFDVLDAQGEKIATVKGNWKGWTFKFTDTAGNEIGEVSKKWAGMGKELFTSADTYVIALHGDSNRTHSALLLAAGLAVDMVFKED